MWTFSWPVTLGGRCHQRTWRTCIHLPSRVLQCPFFSRKTTTINTQCACCGQKQLYCVIVALKRTYRIQVWLIWGIKTRTPQPSTILLKITKVKVIVFVYVSFWSKWSKAIRCSKVFFHSNNMEVIKLLLRGAIVLSHCITSKSLQRFFNCFWQTISCSCFPGPFCGASYFHHS